MNMQFAARKVVVSVLVCLGLVVLCATMAHAQSSGTGAISGTVSDPQGRAVPNATVTATSLSTGQARTATTGPDGDYKFSLIPPGTYRLKFTAAGFKTSEISSETVTVTETAVANQALEVGTINQTVTVESSVETLQTESSTLGTTVNGNTISALPMANGNYTEVLSLAAGATASVDNATALGKGTQDISANGVDPGSNNYQMDGVAVNNIANSGSSNDGTIYTGIPIPSQDAIGEFKIQTSTYDASYGRNPGANVNVVTKSGTNQFHGTGFEFFRNSVLNASEHFYNVNAIAATGEKPAHQILDQNQFGGTIGGPIFKDKLFFFFSYRGTRAKNGVAPAGTTDGALLPFSLDPYAAAGSRGTCGAAIQPDFRAISAVCDATAQAFATAEGITNIVGLRIFQLTTGNSAGVPNNFYIPAPSSLSTCGPSFLDTMASCNFSVPAVYHENQYVANGDWIINSKHALATRYFYTLNPQTPFLGQNGGNLPGTPEHIVFGNQDAVLKLTSSLTSTFVNEARVSFQRNTDNSTVAMPPGGLNSQLGIVPGTGGFEEPPTIIDIFDGFSLFGGLLPNFGPTNQLQLADQISWQHGKHSIRAGYEYEWTNWPLLDSGLQQGLMLTAGALNSGQLPPGFTPGLAAGGDLGPLWNVGCLFCVESIPGEQGITHFYDVRNQSAYVLDDWKISSKLTLNIGLRWEYDGLLSDRLGRLTQVQLGRMAANAAVPTSLGEALTNPVAVQQYLVASNFEHFFGPPPDGVGISHTKNSVDGHAPYSDFGPRIGFAWQPLTGGKLVVRGGFGIFYNRIGLDSVVHAFEQGAPYAQTFDFNPGGARWLQATLATPYPALNLVPLASNPAIGFSPRFADPSTANDPGFLQVNSGLSSPLSYTNGVHIPLVREYSLGIQYEFAPTWVLDLGYVGSSGINLNTYNHNRNTAQLFSPGNDPYGMCQPAGLDGSTTPVCNTVNNTQFRVPFLGYEAAGLNASDAKGYSSYNSLQVTVRHQFSRGLSMQAAYTWSKDLSDVFFGNAANINNADCLQCQYGPVAFNRAHRLAVNFSYDLPFGKESEGVTKKLIDGWNVSGVTIAQTGDYLTFFDQLAGTAFGTSTTSYLTGLATPDYCGAFNRHDSKSPGGTRANLNAYFNTGIFCTPAVVPFGDPGLVVPPPGQSIPAATGFGNVRTGTGEGPGQFNWDFSLMKNTQVTERVRVQFRADFYNAFNHTQFSDPGSGAFGSVGVIDVNNPANNTITHTSVNPRLIQFGLHLYF